MLVPSQKKKNLDNLPQTTKDLQPNQKIQTKKIFNLGNPQKTVQKILKLFINFTQFINTLQPQPIGCFYIHIPPVLSINPILQKPMS